jgi:hypothetical protein
MGEGDSESLNAAISIPLPREGERAAVRAETLASSGEASAE